MLATLLAATVLAAPFQETAPPGQLTAVDRSGKPGILVPLKGTQVSVDIAGISARVTLVQTFQNPSSTPIEAVYTFPMSNDAAVDRMRMNVAGRLVLGQIKKREDARKIYDTARANGQVASLLDQERPNVFTQHVANILPGAQVEVEISYVQTLKYEDGQYEFSFPMVVGPRYLPVSTPDPGKVSPPIIPKDMRTGSGISLSVHLDAGTQLDSVTSVLHDVNVRREGADAAYIDLKHKDEIPNRDFILRYKVKGQGIKEQLVTHSLGDGTGTFCLVLNPPKDVQPDTVRPREVVFVMDQSGSQSGFPLEKSKELTLKLIDQLRPSDTFNVISFSNGAKRLWDTPRQNTPANLDEAREYVNKLLANGGTEFLPAIDLALATPPAGGRLRIVVFNTDGFIGNEFEVLDRIQKYRKNARMFTFGIGNGVNQFLIDAMSEEGRGGAETVTLQDMADAAVSRFLRRTSTPILTDVALDFKGVQVADVSPQNPEDLFAGRPVVITGRYLNPGSGSVTIRGVTGLGPWAREIPLTFDRNGSGGAGVTSLWARRKVQDLTRLDWMAQTRGNQDGRDKTVQEITSLGLKYGIMTAYTSFVAVEQRVVNMGGKQRTVNVPVEMTDGVSYEGIFGESAGKSIANGAPSGLASGGFGGGGGGRSGGYAANQPGGVVAGSPIQTKGVAKDKAETIALRGASDLANVNEQIRNGTLKATVKVDTKLLARSGKLEVQIWVTDVNDKVLKALEGAGLKVDDKDGSLKVVFGTVDASKLEGLAKVEEVVRIGPLEG